MKLPGTEQVLNGIELIFLTLPMPSVDMSSSRNSVLNS